MNEDIVAIEDWA
jgi:CRISPR/Cas system-associated protein Csm6